MPGSDQGFAHPRAVLERFQQAAIDKDLTSMVDLYSEDAIHEFPFTRPGLPSRLEGREQIRAFMQANCRIQRHGTWRWPFSAQEDPSPLWGCSRSRGGCSRSQIGGCSESSPI
jgi:hypothetical protein